MDVVRASGTKRFCVEMLPGRSKTVKLRSLRVLISKRALILSSSAIASFQERGRKEAAPWPALKVAAPIRACSTLTREISSTNMIEDVPMLKDYPSFDLRRLSTGAICIAIISTNESVGGETRLQRLLRTDRRIGRKQDL
jgi:hypothetical protein